MKESTGGALLMGFAAIILLVFIIMSAFFISYGKLFRLKDRIINTIEQKEGLSVSGIHDVIRDNYTGTLETETCYSIVKYKYPGDTKETLRGFSEKVTVYMKFDRTIFGDIINIKIPITGETRLIEKGVLFKELESGNLTAFKSGLSGMQECS